MSALSISFLFIGALLLVAEARKCPPGQEGEKHPTPARIKEMTVTTSGLGLRPRRIFVHAQKPRAGMDALPVAHPVLHENRKKPTEEGRVLPGDEASTGKRRKIRVTKHRHHHHSRGHQKRSPHPSPNVAYAHNGPLTTHGHGPHGGNYKI
ncbi:unnamed protein product, partial [Mesorhabditis spiculigera]